MSPNDMNFVKDRSAFPWRFGAIMVVGYLLATVPQVIIDPLLRSHINYPNRHYPLAYLIAPIAIAVFAATVVAASSLPSRYRLSAVVPYIAGAILSAPIFKPEIPHGNLVFVSAVWVLLGSVTTWVHGYKIVNPTPDIVNSAQISEVVVLQARFEYIKEQTAFWKGLGLGLVAAYLGALITLVQSLHSANTDFISSPKDLLIMNRYINIEIGVLSMFMFVGPIYEILRKVLTTTEFYLDVTEPLKSEITTSG
jgi:hypothetical protein